MPDKRYFLKNSLFKRERPEIIDLVTPFAFDEGAFFDNRACFEAKFFQDPARGWVAHINLCLERCEACGFGNWQHHSPNGFRCIALAPMIPAECYSRYEARCRRPAPDPSPISPTGSPVSFSSINNWNQLPMGSSVKAACSRQNFSARAIRKRKVPERIARHIGCHCAS